MCLDILNDLHEGIPTCRLKDWTVDRKNGFLIWELVKINCLHSLPTKYIDILSKAWFILILQCTDYSSKKYQWPSSITFVRSAIHFVVVLLRQRVERKKNQTKMIVYRCTWQTDSAHLHLKPRSYITGIRFSISVISNHDEHSKMLKS